MTGTSGEPRALPFELPSDTGASFETVNMTTTRPLLTDEQRTDMLSRWTVRANADTLEDVPQLPLPQGGAAYRLKKIIGKGGMGEVWEALQVSLGRVVAVKKLRDSELMSAEERNRRDIEFRQEAIISARLEHPNIVPVHDLGADHEGSPLLAMKLVHGTPWDNLVVRDFVDLSPAEYYARHLPILIAVAQAVAFAHARGVVHRDIKPSQVMIGEFGEVVLMDWGLALVFDEGRVQSGGVAGEAPSPIPTTDSATNPSGTIAYMAPEQTQQTAHEIGPWTDIYLLGGSLYFLLTLTPPHQGSDVRAAFFHAMEGQIDPPERRLTGRDIPRELSTLCLKCLARERDARPASVFEVIHAIQDFLSGSTRRRESVELSAHAAEEFKKQNYTYRALAEMETQLVRALSLWDENTEAAILRQKVIAAQAELALRNGDLVLARSQTDRLDKGVKKDELHDLGNEAEGRARSHRRQRAILLRSTVLLSLVIGGLGVFAHVRSRAADEARLVAELRTHEAESALATAKRARRDAELQRDRARLARSRAEELMNFMLIDLHRELEPLNRLSILEQVATASSNYFATLGEDDQTSATLRQRAIALRNLGTIFAGQGKLASAEESLQGARDLQAGLLALEPQSIPLRLELADSDSMIASYADQKGDAARALQLVDKSLQDLAGSNDAHDANIDAQVSDLHRQRSAYLQRLGRVEDGLAAIQSAIDINGAAAANSKDSEKALIQLAADRRQQSSLLFVSGDIAGSIEALQKARAVYEDLLNRDSANANHQAEVASTLHDLGAMQWRAGDIHGALDSAQKGLSIIAPLAEADTANLRRQAGHADALLITGSLFEETGNDADARTFHEKALLIYEHLVKEDPDNSEWKLELSRIHGHLGDILLRAKDIQASLAQYESLLTLRRDLAAAFPENAEYRRHLGSGLSMTADILAAAGEIDVALKRMDEGIEIRLALVAEDPSNAEWQRDLAVSVTNRGAVLCQAGRVDECIQQLSRGAEIFEKLSQADPTNNSLRADIAMCYANIGNNLDDASRTDEAEVWWLKAAELAELLMRPGDASSVNWQNLCMQLNVNLARVNLDKGNYEAAAIRSRTAADSARAMLKRLPDSEDAREFLAVAQSREGIARMELGATEEALALNREALKSFMELLESDPSVVSRQFGRLKNMQQIALGQWRMEDYAAAAETYREIVSVCRELRDKEGQLPILADVFLGESLLNLADALAILGDPDAAMDRLEECAAAGYDDPESIESDPRLESVRQKHAERFKKVLDTLRANQAAAAESGPE